MFLNEMDLLLEKQTKSCLIIGDMNIDLLSENQETINYNNVIQVNNFAIQNEIKPENATRIGCFKSSLLDHVLVNKNLECDIRLENHCISDHKIMFVNLKQEAIQKVKKNIITKKK